MVEYSTFNRLTRVRFPVPLPMWEEIRTEDIRAHERRMVRPPNARLRREVMRLPYKESDVSSSLTPGTNTTIGRMLCHS